MSEPLESRPYAPGDEQAIIKLFALAFRRPLNLASWRWRYAENPFGGPHIQLMWHGRTLVGHYSVSPVDLCVAGTTWKCALSLDTMTHPAYGGRGIFTTLANNLYQQSEQAGYAMVWGFPNANSHHGFIGRLQWFDIASIPTLWLRAKPSRNNPGNIQQVQDFDERIDELYARELQNWTCSSARRAAVLQWRYFGRAGRDYRAAVLTSNGRVEGYSVYKIFRAENQLVGDIVDLFCIQDFEVFRDLVSWTAHTLFEHGAESVDMWMNESSPFYPCLTSMGFVADSPRTFFGGRILSPHLPRDTVASWPEWYIQMGDSDVF